MAEKRILVVDDVGYNRLVIKKLLSSEGYVVDEAEKSATALYLLRQNRYDLVLTDLSMPDGDGIALFHRAKTELFADRGKACECPPFFLCTAHVESDVVQEAIRAGFSDIIAKPIDRERLFESVRKVLRGEEDAAPHD